MAKYTNEYSKLPHLIYEKHYYQDVDDNIAGYVNEIKSLQSQGKYDEANRYVERYKNILSKYVFSVESFNAIEEETRNLEIMAIERKQCIFYDVEPDYPVMNDVWISDREDIEE